MSIRAHDAPKNKGWRDHLDEARAALGNVPRAFALLWEAAPGGTIGLTTVTVLDAAYPAAQAWAGKMILDGVVESIKLGRTPADGVRAVAPYLILEFALVIAKDVGGRIRALVRELIDLRLGYLVTGRIVRKALTLEDRKSVV